MNSWKRSLFSVGAGAVSGPEDGSGPGGAGSGAGRLKTGLL